jgi:hypothetical protein
MSQIDQTMEAFHEYLREGPMALSKSSATSYASIIKHALTTAEPEDITNPQMIHYLRSGLPTSYSNNFPSAWKAFQKFCLMDDVEIPDIPEIRRVRFVHPIAPDVILMLSKYYNGIPEDLTWEKFLAVEKDNRMLHAALRIYSFFTGSPAPMATQPLFPRAADGHTALPMWVLDSVAASRSRRTLGLAEQMHADLNMQMSEAGVPAGVSADVYRAFVGGQESIRRREQVSFEESFEEWEKLVQNKDYRSLILSVRAFCRIPKDADMAGIIFQ